MFDTNMESKVAIKEQSEKVGDALKAALVDPLAQARLLDCTPQLKADGVVVQYALRHFKEFVFARVCLNASVCAL